MMSDNYSYQSYQEPISPQMEPNKPFNRKIEKVLTWIGLVLHLIWAVILTGAAAMVPKLQSENPEVRQALMEQGQDPDILNSINPTTYIILAVVMTVIPFILALIAVFLFKKAVLAGILLILAAVLSVILSGSFIAALLWLVAAIMLFVRKPKNPRYVVSN